MKKKIFAFVFFAASFTIFFIRIKGTENLNCMYSRNSKLFFHREQDDEEKRRKETTKINFCFISNIFFQTIFSFQGGKALRFHSCGSVRLGRRRQQENSVKKMKIHGLFLLRFFPFWNAMLPLWRFAVKTKREIHEGARTKHGR